MIFRKKYKHIWYIFLGVVSIGIGTLMNFSQNEIIKIVGIVNISIGTFLIAYMSVYVNSKEIETMLAKAESIENKINEIKASSLLSTKALKGGEEGAISKIEEMEKVEKEFIEWAEGFIENKQIREVEEKKRNIDLEARELRLSKEWIFLYEYAFNTIKNILNAYNQLSKDPIEFTIPDLPLNLFSLDAEKYKAEIKFKKYNCEIKLLVYRPFEKDKIPTVNVTIESKQDRDSELSLKSELSLTINIKNLFLDVDRWRYEIHINDLKDKYPVDKSQYKESIKELFKTLIEYQLI